VDIKKDPSGQWKVWLNGGRLQTEWLATDWIKEAVERGAGEILLTSMDHDGVKEGFALDITRTISQSVAVPVIASGGAGKVEHFKDVFTIGAADAALAASIFHFGEIPIPSLKNYLQHEGISIRR
jgi:cyclase